MHHNDPYIRPLEFLYACMRDTSLPLSKRMEAASRLGKLGHADGPPSPTVLIKITRPWQLEEDMWLQWELFSAEMEEYRLSLPQAEQDELVRAVNRCLRCNQLGVARPISDMDGKGHA